MERMRLRTATSFFAFARPGNWFVSKIPPLLAVAYLEILQLRIAPGAAVRLLACGLISICCVAVYGHVVNDIFDREADRRANKANRLANMQPVRRLLLAWAFLIAGFLPAPTAGYSAGALSLLGLNYLWPTIYSIPLTRLKERGLLGVACDALGSHITPTLFVLTLFASSAPAAASTGQTAITVVATLWAGVLGLKGILHHQIADRDNDIRSRVVTLATKARPETLQRFLTIFNLLVELPVSALFAALAPSWRLMALAAFGGYTASEAIKYKLGFQFALSANPSTIRPSVPFTNERFYVLWMPMAAAIRLGLANPALLWVPLLHAAIFHRPVAEQVADWSAIIRIATLAYRGHRARHA